MIGTKWANNQCFNPRNVSNLLAWLDGKDPAANGIVPVNGSSISTWTDKSANGFNFTQTTGANQPIYSTAGINSRPCLTFNGTSQYIRCANTSLAQNLTTDMTVFFVARYASQTQFYVNFCTDPTPDPPRIVLHMPFSGSSRTLFDFGNAEAGRASGAWGGSANTNYIVTATASVSNSIQQVYLNNVLKTSNTTPQTCSFGTAYQFTIGALDTLTSAVDYLNGNIGEFIIYNKYLNATENSNVYNYLKNRWGI